MHDLRLVGVHDDGEHLLLVDDHGDRYLIAVDEALRAAVRRDRTRLGQLQIEVEGGLRPRDVQARIRAGATREEVAAVAGWSVEKVERYEGPVLAERAHVAELARRVRLRRRGGEPVLLGSEVAARLAERGVDERSVTWDSWRTEEGPWTAVVYFVAGGRERQARWHLDLASSSVTPTDDEARWLSEESAPAEGPVPGLRLSSVPSSAVYDIEADGGVNAPGSRSAGHASGRSDAGSLDLVTAMRTRRRESGRGVPPRPSTARPVVPASDDPASVPGARHPARRRRPQAEPLELDPTLMDDPPAAHPPASTLAVEPADPADAELLGDAALFDEPVDALSGDTSRGEPAVELPAVELPVDELPVDELSAEFAVDEPVDRSAPELPLDEAAAESPVDGSAAPQPETAVDTEETAAPTTGPTTGPAAAPTGPSPSEAEPLMTAAAGPPTTADVEPLTTADVEPLADPASDTAARRVEPAATEPAATEPAATEPAATVPAAAAAAPAANSPQPARQNGRPRGSNGRGGRNRRSSVPSWDDIMFGAKRD